MGFRGDYSFLFQGRCVVFVLMFVSVMFRDGFFSFRFYVIERTILSLVVRVLFFLC